MEPHPYSLFQISAKLLLILLLVLLNGFFVAAEFAIVKVRSTQIETLVKKKHRRAALVDNVIHHLDDYLSATQLGITLASLGLGWLGEPFVAGWLRPPLSALGASEQTVQSIAYAVAFVGITFAHITIGEQAPKLLAIQRPKVVTLWVAPA